MLRQSLLLLFLLSFLFCCSCTYSQSQTYTCEYRNWAELGTMSFLYKFWDRPNLYTLQTWPSTGSTPELAAYWIFAQGYDTLVDCIEQRYKLYQPGEVDPSGWDYLVSDFFDGQDRRGWQSEYNDDMNWMALTLLHAYDVMGNTSLRDTREKYLNKAKELFVQISSGYDMSCCGTQPGGIWWDKNHTQKATASNAGPVILAARLYEKLMNETGSRVYLDFAIKIYDFWMQKMVNMTSYQVCDHFDVKDNKYWWRFTYNEGLMVGASTELYRVTRQRNYLTNALKFANFIVTHETRGTPEGQLLVLFDGDKKSCQSDCEQFKGIAFRYLSQLINVLRTEYHTLTDEEKKITDSIQRVLHDSVVAIWEQVRNANNVFPVDWSSGERQPIMEPVTQAMTTSAVMSLNIFAMNNC